MRIILKYFPTLTLEQILRFEKLAPLYRGLNTWGNIIPRKDVDLLYERHILHSLAISKVISFSPGSKILDVGTGGGFPGIPLAILFPACQFTLVDSMRKRIKVVQAVVDELELTNVEAIHGNVEDIYEEFDFVVSRAVKAFPDLVGLVKKNISQQFQNTCKNGIIYLKGGNFEEEIEFFRQTIKVQEIQKYFTEPFFETKKVIYLPVYK